MSATTHARVEELESDEEREAPWWRDRAVMIPVASGAAFVAGVACEWSGSRRRLWCCSGSACCRASTFVPGALRKPLPESSASRC